MLLSPFFLGLILQGAEWPAGTRGVVPAGFVVLQHPQPRPAASPHQHAWTPWDGFQPAFVFVGPAWSRRVLPGLVFTVTLGSTLSCPAMAIFTLALEAARRALGTVWLVPGYQLGTVRASFCNATAKLLLRHPSPS